MNTLEELKAKAAAILESCEGWKKCQDGSYEMALHYAGFNEVMKQIREYKECWNERTN
jgi:hypothetical protein